ncbi:GNAT family N-acetyltransferase [Vibrio tapetis subsp. quintayensis]|uniref:GNAT family N-acetyltransferase n=1 Tax=Vibrio tapetis TaxID=52443 RepID=UPI0025B480EA|nr:GNAT family N-acetyltransferase [Vibrio tapetis]MDN3681310.1 GNAT family N-acetyltransferase [Vibrio tapetis subsp. quintayensis]
MNIIELPSLDGYQPSLETLLIDCVSSGASVGFIMPIDHQEVTAYWQGVASDLANNTRKIWLAVEDNQLLGVVQLSLCTKRNGRHRGEIEKLMVKTSARGRGISTLLMQTLEERSTELGLSLLVLDTRKGDVASDLYRKLGYIESGQIPQFALSSNGELDATVIFYKLLGENQ